MATTIMTSTDRASRMKRQRLETLRQANKNALNAVSPGLYDALESLGLANLKTLKKALTPLITQLSKQAELIAAGVIPTVAFSDTDDDTPNGPAMPTPTADADDAEGMENQSPKTCVYRRLRPIDPETLETKTAAVVASLKRLYPNSTDQEILNISFRQGDRLHAQWTADEEAILIPQLVSDRQKPVGLTVSKTGSHVSPAGVRVKVDWIPDSHLSDYYEIPRIASQYTQAGLQNEADDISTYLHTSVDDMVRDLVDESLPLSIMGLLYGYPVESTIALITRSKVIREAEAKTKARRLAADRAAREATKAMALADKRASRSRIELKAH